MNVSSLLVTPIMYYNSSSYSKNGLFLLICIKARTAHRNLSWQKRSCNC